MKTHHFPGLGVIIKYHWHPKKSVFMENFKGARYSPKITITKFKVLGSGHTPAPSG